MTEMDENKRNQRKELPFRSEGQNLKKFGYLKLKKEVITDNSAAAPI